MADEWCGEFELATDPPPWILGTFKRGLQRMVSPKYLVNFSGQVFGGFEGMREEINRHGAGSAIWLGLGDEVEVFAPGANVATDAPIWTGEAIRTVPEATDAPGEGLSYQQPIRGFSFRLAGAPVLKQKTLIRHDARVWSVDEIAEAGSDQIRVTVFPVG